MTPIRKKKTQRSMQGKYPFVKHMEELYGKERNTGGKGEHTSSIKASLAKLSGRVFQFGGEYKALTAAAVGFGSFAFPFLSHPPIRDSMRSILPWLRRKKNGCSTLFSNER